MLRSSLQLIKHGILTRRAWWFTATARTRARFSRTVLGSFWLGIANLLCSLLLGGVYGAVFKVDNFNDLGNKIEKLLIPNKKRLKLIQKTLNFSKKYYFKKIKLKWIKKISK